MNENENNSSSEFLKEEKFIISSTYSDITPLYECGGRICRLFKAMRFGKWCVLKCLKPEYANNPEFTSLLQKEFDIGYRFSHPNIVKMINFEVVENLGVCIVMEYIDGRTLKEWLHERKRSKKEIIDILRSIGSTLDYIHQIQVVHRDIKPANIMITNNGDHIKIIDFGLADADNYAILKQPAGTMRYVAPEQCDRNIVVDGRADIYSFGVIITDANSTLTHHSRILRKIAEKCCEQNRDHRYSNLSEIKWGDHTDKKNIVFMAIIIIVLCSIGTYIYVNHFQNQNKEMKANTKVSETPRSAQMAVKDVESDGNAVQGKADRNTKTSPKLKPNTAMEKASMGTQIREMTRENWEDFLKRLNSGESHTARCDLPLSVSLNTDNNERQKRLDNKIKAFVKSIAIEEHDDFEMLYGIANSIMHDEQSKFILDPVNSKRIEDAWQKAIELGKETRQEDTNSNKASSVR